MADSSKQLMFGPWKLHESEKFLETELSFAIVNTKPVVPGHVLILPKRVVPLFVDLTGEEVTDIWLLAQKVGKAIQPHFGATSATYAIQDGREAGQTVPHVHIHILPRKKGDFEKNDEVYDKIEASESEMGVVLKKRKVDLDEDRKARTEEEMAAEATELRSLFV